MSAGHEDPAHWQTEQFNRELNRVGGLSSLNVPARYGMSEIPNFGALPEKPSEQIAAEMISRVVMGGLPSPEVIQAYVSEFRKGDKNSPHWADRLIS